MSEAGDDLADSAESSDTMVRNLDRLLGPVRRLVAYGIQQPDAVRFVETNLDRWLQPVLAIPLPDALRDDVLGMAGQVSGFDDAPDRAQRLARIRGHIRQLDQVLGLPLPTEPTERNKRRGSDRNKAGRGKEPVLAEAQDEPTGKGEGRRRRSDRRGRKRDRNENRKDLDDDALDDAILVAEEPEQTPEVRPSRDREAGERRRGWNGDLTTSLQEISPDPDLVGRLAAAGLHTAGDLLYRVPLGEETFKVEGAGRDLEAGRVAVGGRRASAWTRLRPDGRHTTTAVLRGQGETTLYWADPQRAATWLKNVQHGQRVIVVGDWDEHVVLEPVAVAGEGRSLRLGRYGIPGVGDDEIRSVLAGLLPRLDRVRDPLPPAYRGEHPSLAEALQRVHGTTNAAGGSERLAFDESVATSLAAAYAAFETNKPRGIPHSVLHEAIGRLLDEAEVRLTDEQELVLDAVKRDLRSSRPMRRVIFGDPGGGKGLLAVCTAAMIAESKAQVACISADPVLCEQRFAFAQPLLEAAGLVVRKIDRFDDTIRDSLKKGQVHVVFGGPDLVAPGVEYRRLGLVIVSDDGGDALSLVNARSAPTPDLLVVPTSTPTAAALVAGWPSFGLNYLRGAPRPNVIVKTSNQRVSAYAQARMALLEKRLVAVLFPLIDNRDALDPTEASRVMKVLTDDALPDARVSLYHGAMPRTERMRTYQDFRHRRADVMLATTPLEESAPIPGLEVVVVEHAHRMPAKRLARLSGLGVSHVTLVVSEDTPESAIERLQNLVSNGWTTPYPVGERLPALEYVDLQSSTPETFDLILRGRHLAMEILNNDNQLRSGTHSDLLRMVRARWSTWYGDEPCPLPEPGAPSSGSGGGSGPTAQRKRRRRRRR